MNFSSLHPKLIIRFVITFVFLINSANGWAVEKRIALVIGVANYSHIQKLENTVNDTRLLATILEDIDFEVTRLEDPNYNKLRDELKTFAFKAETADVALIYFAGHGVEFAGINYIIPADINIRESDGIARRSISLDEVLISVDRARQLKIVILDSCRNDPFLSENSSKSTILVKDASVRRAGLAPASPERGTLVAYAAEAGQVALDGLGENSPYALALAKHLGTPDLEIGLVFRRIRDTVLNTTGNSQVPHTYGSLPGKPYFFAGALQSSNILKKADQRKAWGKLKADQETMLVALADNGDRRALKGLAYMRLNPEEKNYDPKRAIKLLERASKTGDAEARYELGRLYEKGIGGPQDVKKALDLFRQASDANYADAVNDLGFLHHQGGLGIVPDRKLAIQYFGRAAELRHPEAMFNFAALIDDGVVPGKSSKDSARYLYNALRSGNEKVHKQLVHNSKMFKRPTRLELQRLLSEANFYSGGIDGQIGPQTIRGLNRAYGLIQ